jgi:hypothetical protein
MFQRCSRLAIVALIGSFLAIPATSALAQGGSNPAINRLELPANGSVATQAGVSLGTIAGTFSISRFAIQEGQLVAIGQFNATYRDVDGVVKNVVSQIAWPVADGGSGGDAAASCDTGAASAACDILNLVLGPLHLDLLGLVIDLNQVVLNITATTGSGDLLGNLLCAITGLLDNPPFGQQIVNLLNQLIGILSGL